MLTLASERSSITYRCVTPHWARTVRARVIEKGPAVDAMDCIRGKRIGYGLGIRYVRGGGLHVDMTATSSVSTVLKYALSVQVHVGSAGQRVLAMRVT